MAFRRAGACGRAVRAEGGHKLQRASGEASERDRLKGLGEHLEVVGRLAEVERAQADGRWEAAYESQARSRIPEDLERELRARSVARASFERLSSQNRYAILHRLADAKRAETRERRLAKFVEMLGRRDDL